MGWLAARVYIYILAVDGRKTRSGSGSTISTQLLFGPNCPWPLPLSGRQPNRSELARSLLNCAGRPTDRPTGEAQRAPRGGNLNALLSL